MFSFTSGWYVGAEGEIIYRDRIVYQDNPITTPENFVTPTQDAVFDAPPRQNANLKEHARQIARVVTRINQGKFNAVGGIVLNETPTAEIDPEDPTAETVVVDPRCGTFSYIQFMPVTRLAAAELASGAMYVSARTSGQFTITHSAAPEQTRSFYYLIIG